MTGGTGGSAPAPEPVPEREWTDAEWLRLMAECPPETPVREARVRVAWWRRDGDHTPY